MTGSAPAAVPPQTRLDSGEPEDDRRMSFGDHLEELRQRVIYSLLGVLVTTIVAFAFAKQILVFLFQPLLVVQHSAGLRPELQALSPPAAFAAYLKIGFLTGLIVAMPWVLWQFWQFVAAGLYRREKRFVKLFAPATVVLFTLGVVFLYYVVLPIVLLFFVTFNRAFNLPELSPVGIQSLLLPKQEAVQAVQPEEGRPRLPVLAEDPLDPRDGDVWVNSTVRALMFKTSHGVMYVPLELWESRSPVHSQFAIDFYISFVLLLALAFGLAFELPVAVFFLALTGLVTTAMMARARRYVLLVVVILAAVLTPPDVVSQLLLAIPMYLLFELGLLVARVSERRMTQGERAS
ncbi:MAG TPA: twin-arginine translocase subunit TatC [Phycisphaerae bacterium]|nr:twin-arginine translocase subunit TatC [Phycisphaerae bacterium]HNU44548.1 twin-arginine translocase subunit TatC [Phycisphaerae bacterium]